MNNVKHLKKESFPAIKEVYPRNNWIYAQDGASSHTANMTQAFLQKNSRCEIHNEEWMVTSVTGYQSVRFLFLEFREKQRL